jgi:hypothetical protein
MKFVYSWNKPDSDVFRREQAPLKDSLSVGWLIGWLVGPSVPILLHPKRACT